MENTIFGYPDIGTFMKETRIQYGKKVKEISAHLDVTDSFIYAVESGEKYPAFEKFALFTSFFGYRLDTDTVNTFKEMKKLNERNPEPTQQKTSQEANSTSISRDNPLNVQSPSKDQQPYPYKVESAVEALQALDPYVQDDLLKQLNQEIEMAQMNQKPVITFNELKKQLLTALQEWNHISQYKDAPMDYKEEPILTISGNYVKSEEISTEVVIEIDLNKAIFFVPKTNENFIKPLIDIFSGPKFTDYLSSYPNLETDDEIVQFVVLNPTIPILTLLSALPNKPSSRSELSDAWMKNYLEDQQTMESFLKASDL